MHGHPAVGPGLLEVAAEAGRAVGRQVVDADLVERPTRGGQEGVDVAGDQAGADEPDPRRALPAAGQAVGGQRRERGRPGGADDRCLEAGERITGVVVVQDQHRRGPRDPGGDVLREARDPLQAVGPHLPPDRGRQGDDPRATGGPGSGGSTTAD